MFYGIYHFGKKRVACRNGYCVTCARTRLFEGRRSVMVFHLAFIPLLPFAVRVRYFCRYCDERLGSRRPSRRVFLIAGLACGLMFTVIGLKWLFQGAEAGSGVTTFGVLLVSGLYYLLRKQRYVTYDAGVASVVPLPADACPYCGAALFASTKPRCHDCKVRIVTK